MFLYLLKFRGILTGIVLLGLTPTLVFASAVTTLQKIPFPGKEAFYAENPKDPQQKILLVPSDHLLNLRFVEPKIVEAIKASDIMIQENISYNAFPGFMSWDASTMVAQIFKTSFPFERLKQFGLLKKDPFLLQDAPWTQALSPATRDFLIQSFQSSIPDGLSLDNLHPAIVSHILVYMADLEAKKFGMDTQTERDFGLKGKVILELESMEEKVSSSSIEDRELIKIAQFPVNLKLTNLLDEDVELYKKISLQASKKELEKSLKAIANNTAVSEALLNSYEVIKDFLKSNPDMADALFARRPEFKKPFESMTGTTGRTKLWIPVLLKHLSDNKGKSVTVMVGALHFSGSDGLIKLLTDQGFKIRTFSLP